MNRIVADIKDGRAIVLNSDGTFEEIKNKNYVIGQEIEKETVHIKKQFLTAACLLLVTALSFGGVYAYRTPVEYIYVDINPSLRLDINMFHRVISVTGLNTEAESIIAFDKKPEKCVEEIIEECIEKGYLNGDNNGIEITVSDNKNENLLKQRCEKFSGSGYSVVVQSAERKDVEYANAHGISAGKRKEKSKDTEAAKDAAAGETDANLTSEGQKEAAPDNAAESKKEEKSAVYGKNEKKDAQKPQQSVKEERPSNGNNVSKEETSQSGKQEQKIKEDNTKDVSQKEKKEAHKEEKSEPKQKEDNKVKKQNENIPQNAEKGKSGKNGKEEKTKEKDKGGGKPDAEKENKKSKEEKSE